METLLKILRGINLTVLFIVSVIIGFVFREVLFFTLQMKILEYYSIVKPMKEIKGGADSPEEAWVKFLDLAGKGDIEGALQYVWPENREGTRKTLETYKKYGKLEMFISTFSKKIERVERPDMILMPDEALYYNEGFAYKELDYLGASTETKEFLDKIWADEKSNVMKIKEPVIFKYNPYTKKWFIK